MMKAFYIAGGIIGLTMGALLALMVSERDRAVQIASLYYAPTCARAMVKACPGLIAGANLNVCDDGRDPRCVSLMTKYVEQCELKADQKATLTIACE